MRHSHIVKQRGGENLMGNLLFSPSGRIGPGQFMSGVLVLVIISAVLGLLPVFMPALGLLNVIGLVLIWCWIVLWVKRYHDAGKSGWMCLIPIVVWLVIGGIVGALLPGLFADPAALEAMEAATEAGDFGAILQSAMGGGMTKTGQLINVGLGAVISYVVALIFNGMIKQDTHSNQYGPYGDVGNTFS